MLKDPLGGALFYQKTEIVCQCGIAYSLQYIVYTVDFFILIYNTTIFKNSIDYNN